MTVEEPQCSATHPFMIHSFSLLSHSLSTLRTHRRRPCTVRWGSSVRTGRRLWAAPPSPCGSAWPVRPPCRWCSRCSPGDRCAGAPLAGLKKGGGDGGGERMGGREDEEQQLIKRTVDMNISINRSRQFSRCSAKLRWTVPVRKYSTVSADAAVFFFFFLRPQTPARWQRQRQGCCVRIAWLPGKMWGTVLETGAGEQGYSISSHTVLMSAPDTHACANMCTHTHTHTWIHKLRRIHGSKKKKGSVISGFLCAMKHTNNQITCEDLKRRGLEVD